MDNDRSMDASPMIATIWRIRAWMLRHPLLHRCCGRIGQWLRSGFFIRKSKGMLEETVHPGAVRQETPESPSEDQLPEWLIEEWRALNEIDPALFPEPSLVNSLACHRVHGSAASAVYHRLREAFGGAVDSLFLLPRLDIGGAERVALHYIHAVRSLYPDRRILVVTTDAAASPWFYRLPCGVGCIEFGRLTAHLNDIEREHLLIRLLVQHPVMVVHLINSRLGFAVLKRFGPVLCRRMRWYTNLFCTDFTPEGRRIGYAIEFLPHVVDSLTAVLLDNRRFSRQLIQWYGIDPQKLIVHYQPVTIEPSRALDSLPKEEGHSGSPVQTTKRPCGIATTQRPQDDGGRFSSVKRRCSARLDVLWAGRIDHQKRPDILIEIIEACRRLPYFFHIYGVSVLNQDRYTSRLRQVPNAWYYGAFDTFASLAAQCFDVFLYTSQWDGLPTLLLDAVWSGLPVIASDVGGISELIVHEHSGLLVRPFDSVEGYVRHLHRIEQCPEEATRMAAHARRIVMERHNWHGFCEEVANIPGYGFQEQ